MLTPKFWKKYFKVYDYMNSLIPYRDLLKEICVVAEIKAGQKVLDLGSGTGNLSVLLANSGAKVIGLDYSLEGIEIHKSKGGSEVVHHDLNEKLPFEDSAFDVVVSNNVLYTISREKRGKIINEVSRVTKHGGKVVISNIIEDFNPKKIYFGHIRESIRLNGFSATILQLLKLIMPTIKIMYYNHLINKENDSGGYDFFLPNEQSELLREHGFKNVSEEKKVYCNQALLVSGIR